MRRKRLRPKRFLPERKIASRVRALAKRISADYRGKPLTVVAVLKGGFVFLADLVRLLPGDVRVEFLATRSYGDSRKSSGRVRLLKDVGTSVAGRHVLLLEDIVDTGRTVAFLSRHFARRRAASFAVATLLDKPSAREVEVALNYIGFTVPPAFLVGYGLDAAEQYRNLPHLAVLPEKRA